MGSFADYLYQNFYFPVKAAGCKTPQDILPKSSSPAIDKVVPELLRRDCLIRDHHRCVVSRQFDITEAGERRRRDAEPLDDEDCPLTGPFAKLEVAHIIPQSIMFVDDESDLKIALSILDMFDPRASQLIEGSNIDRPSNAISLESTLRTCFSQFQITFEAIDSTSSAGNTYRIDSTNALLQSSFRFPVTQALLRLPKRTIDPPSGILLAVHRAIAHVLDISAAGAYTESVMKEIQEAAMFGLKGPLNLAGLC